MVRVVFSEWIVTSILLGVLAGAAQAQTTPSKSPSNSPGTSASAPLSANNWNTLTEPQKMALAPLQEVWGNISPIKKQKWLDIAVGYHMLSSEGQATLHFRMKEWASLTAKQRDQARRNFAQTRLSADDKQSQWQAYQALSAEEKQKFASSNTAARTAGAAPALKPVAQDKLVTTRPPTKGDAVKSDSSNKTPRRATVNNPSSAPTAPATPAK